VFHLGRPRYAFRAVLGLRTSWMSREIAAFGLFAAAAVAYAVASFSGSGIERGLHEALRWTVATLGVVGIACSVAIYHATRRAWWTASIASLVVLALGELAERTLFFAASSSPGMPGAVR